MKDMDFNHRVLINTQNLGDLITWLEYGRTSGYIAARQSKEQEEYWANLLKDVILTQKELYLVQGSTGEYDDYREWIVKGYTNKQKAEDHVKKANNWLKENGLNQYATIWDGDLKNPFDSNMRVDYTGAEYSIEESELEIN